MDKENIIKILEEVRTGKRDINSAYEELKYLPFEDIDFAKIDHHRIIRRGLPEVIFCEGKSTEQILLIVNKIIEKDANVIGTKCSYEKYNFLREHIDNIEYHSDAGIFFIKIKEIKKSKNSVAILSAGTSDIPIANEAALILEFFGIQVQKYFDVGVAGIHRLFDFIDKINESKVIIAVAGMEGALASVIAGLTDKPVIAVPTSIGYGANFNGLSALLTMLNSCSGGIGVVNIDNGFGAAYLSALIIKQIEN